MNDKIRALMLKSGLSEDATTGLCEALDQHLSERYARQDAEFNAKLAKAKKVCVEEVETHKRELARRVQIFAEAKGNAIETTIAKQSAIKESAAFAKLKDIQAMLHGVELNGEQNGTLRAEVTELKRRVQGLSEERNKAVEQANRANAIAEKVLKRNRLLEAQRMTPVKTEAKAVAKPIAKTGGRPTTTRPTLVENQTRSIAPQRDLGFSPDAIAALI